MSCMLPFPWSRLYIPSESLWLPTECSCHHRSRGSLLPGSQHCSTQSLQLLRSLRMLLHGSLRSIFQCHGDANEKDALCSVPMQRLCPEFTVCGIFSLASMQAMTTACIILRAPCWKVLHTWLWDFGLKIDGFLEQR